jgi:hypothetical protein
VRREEWTPSYAGGSAKADFLLKEEGIVIEVKKTRQGLSVSDICHLQCSFGLNGHCSFFESDSGSCPDAFPEKSPENYCRVRNR